MPPAVIAWLDYSQADQRRAREIVAMFSQAESRDELGLGQIRDALSDTLFPWNLSAVNPCAVLAFCSMALPRGSPSRTPGPATFIMSRLARAPLNRRSEQRRRPRGTDWSRCRSSDPEPALYDLLEQPASFRHPEG